MAPNYLREGYACASRGTAKRPPANRAAVRPIARAASLFLLIVLAPTSVGALWLSVAAYQISQKLPAVDGLDAPQYAPATEIVSSDGVVLGTLQTRVQKPVPLDAISRDLISATLATEDNRFYEHGPVDPRGLLRAVLSNLVHRNAFSEGGSTITQQLARTRYLTTEKTYRRKIEEMLLARKIEQTYSKDDILNAYLNDVYYGSGAYGAEAASLTYFGKSARNLTLGEAAMLAGLPQRPAAFAPNAHLQAAMNRRSHVLARMVAAGRISEAQAANARAEQPVIVPPRSNSLADMKAPYFVARVIKQISRQMGPEVLYSGARIVTTLNWTMQRAAERAIRDGLRRGWATTGALVAIDPKTGYVRALVGGADFRKDQFDAASQGVRQPGSAFKPFVYAAAFDNDVCNLLTEEPDEKLTIAWKPRPYVVRNYSGTYRGKVQVLDAIAQSINTVAVEVADATGPSVVADYAQRLGISTTLVPGLPLALGASGVHPIDLCSAYSAFANCGVRMEPTFVTQVISEAGTETARDDQTSRTHGAFLSTRALNEINVALKTVVTGGTGFAASAIADAHGKTGTTSNHLDAWFCGYTGDLAAVVWMAHPRQDRRRGTMYTSMPGATGGALCAPVWRKFMAAALPVQQRANGAAGVVSRPILQPTLAQITAELTPAPDQQTADQGAGASDPGALPADEAGTVPGSVSVDSAAQPASTSNAVPATP